MDNVKTVQTKILEIAIFIDKVCRDNNIEYFLMGGTALGAVRHKGFIPWDDDFDIFMTPSNYSKFKKIISNMQQDKYYLQEWSVTKNYLEYSKLRMNGTTFIEEVFQNRKDMHHGIYVDIMILHKCPNNMFKQYFIYFISKYLTLLGLSQRNWRPKTNFQNVILNLLKFLPNRLLSYFCYKLIYKYDDLVTVNSDGTRNGAVRITKSGFVKHGVMSRRVGSHLDDCTNIHSENDLNKAEKYLSSK